MFPPVRMERGGTPRLNLEHSHSEPRCSLLSANDDASQDAGGIFDGFDIEVIANLHLKAPFTVVANLC